MSKISTDSHWPTAMALGCVPLVFFMSCGLNVVSQSGILGHIAALLSCNEVSVSWNRFAPLLQTLTQNQPGIVALLGGTSIVFGLLLFQHSAELLLHGYAVSPEFQPHSIRKRTRQVRRKHEVSDKNDTVPLTEIVRIINLNRLTGILTIHAPDKTTGAYLHFRDGDVFDASILGQSGEAALELLLKSDRVPYHFIATSRISSARTVFHPTGEYLGNLFEGKRFGVGDFRFLIAGTEYDQSLGIPPFFGGEKSF